MASRPCPHCARARRTISACWQEMHAAAGDAETKGAKIEAAVIRGIVNAMSVAAENYLAAQNNTESGEPLAPSPIINANREDAMT